MVATELVIQDLELLYYLIYNKVVVNYDFPLEVEDYVHRIGRTSGVGANGLSIFFSEQDAMHASDLIKAKYWKEQLMWKVHCNTLRTERYVCAYIENEHVALLYAIRNVFGFGRGRDWGTPNPPQTS
ncbi:hypothetical protein LguiA_016990 [Lonicera macranthoides]